MYAIASLLVVVAVSLLITRVATVILVATGMSGESARFQARSAFTGAGFTTSESEEVTTHPLRRRVVMALMLLGNAGIVASASSLILGFKSGGAGSGWLRIIELAVEPEDWVAERTLADVALRDAGVVVLGINRAGGYLTAPVGSTRIRSDDVLVLYGAADVVTAIDRRRAGPEGDRAHEDAVRRHRLLVADERASGPEADR